MSDHHTEDQDYEAVHGQTAWEERYQSKTKTWSGNPNAALVAELSALTPGTALDAGAGEGGDACWLASRGWQVTATDISPTALDRTADNARSRGFEVECLHLDLTRNAPTAAYDLVTSHFLQLPTEHRRIVFANLAGAVTPGGTLLIVGHDLSDRDSLRHHHPVEMFWTAAEIAADLGPGWTIEVAESRARTAPHPETGEEIDIHDAVMRARRAA